MELEKDLMQIAQDQARRTTEELVKSNTYPEDTYQQIYQRELQQEIELERQRKRNSFSQLSEDR